MIIIKKILSILKNKKAVTQSTDFVIFFFVAVVLVLILIELLIGVFSIYTMNVMTSNIARVVSVNGEISQTQSVKLYESAQRQMGNRIHPETLELTLETTDATTTIVPAQKVVITNSNYPEYKVNLGDEFTVHGEAQITLFHVAGKAINTTISATSSGVGEVYFK